MPLAPPFSLLIKPTGAICNLDCTYCYYLSRGNLYPGSGFRMDHATLTALIGQTLASQPGPEVTFAWQGGEPLLMGLDFFRRAMSLQRQLCPPAKSVANTIQTNATLIDAEWAAFFRRHDFLVGVSLDGPQPLHDAFRVDKGGAPTFRRVMAGLAHLRTAGVAVNILATVHAANADHALPVYRFLRDEVGAQYIQFIPIVEREAGAQGNVAGVSARSVGATQYGDFLNTIFDEWVRHDVGKVFVQIFDVALGAWLGEPSSLCIFRETCGEALALEHNGDLYSCDHFVDEAHRLGNIRLEPIARMVGSPAQRAFGQAKRDSLPRQCRECPVRFACHGECPKNRFLTTPDGEPGLNYLCAGYFAFFTHIDAPMRLMATELRQQRPPSNVMALWRANE
ncbi:MAG: anaerobic sulfatase maturase [Caldilineaceae bacterium]|nr:anaerobic sulfatase maturase [Caldilineaceae bacterium]MBP8109964.1 anaerobic sulfatase maturase [Caldilineaceae bacterium]MBP8122316.1 anaerobic sulfatase maturase [Caldilineaceae bacterium]MBP9072674.1 anaerobic sulfatase maturase [Caldilineaceae bacterium]